jgi:hypothetical protein
LPKTSIGKPDFKALENEERAKREKNEKTPPNNNAPGTPSL